LKLNEAVIAAEAVKIHKTTPKLAMNDEAPLRAPANVPISRRMTAAHGSMAAFFRQI